MSLLRLCTGRSGKQLQLAQNEGRLFVEPIGETGRWFKQTHKDTPASAITAHTAFDSKDKQSLWYSCKNYRINLYCDSGRLRIRDLHVFSEKLSDPFENRVCEENDAAYYTLPVADGNIHSGNGVLAGIYFQETESGKEIICGKLVFSEASEGVAKADFENISLTLSENGIRIDSEITFVLKYRFGKTDSHFPKVESRSKKELRLTYDGTSYGLELKKGTFTSDTEIEGDRGHAEIKIPT